ncbi:MAG: hypothetical protein IAX22_01625 [Candidatus Bathyarchaeota archaeon]|nr:hypothetical protein [Thermoproteota archaeon]MDT8781331.1 hypothetical protein [Candidatus Bathyarchaeota archaeon]
MQSDKSKTSIIPNLKDEETKRTTVVLDRNEREFITSLIREGKESGIKPLISKMLEIYRSMNVDDWNFPGEYYCGISRIAFVNVELISILTSQIPKEQWRQVGLQMGQALQVSIQSTLGVDATKQENWEAVFRRLKVQGFGDFYLKDKFMVLKTPFINDCEICRGIMEGLFSVELETRTAVPPLVFELVKNP